MRSKNSELLITKDDVDLSDADFRRFGENTLTAMRSLSDKNSYEYMRTLRYWQDFCKPLNIHALDFDLPSVEKFLTENTWSHNTRRTRLAHLKKFSSILAASDTNTDSLYKLNHIRLGFIKSKNLGGEKQVLKTRSLTHRDIFALFAATDDISNTGTRDKAILGLMILGGLRACEIVSLKWEHIEWKTDKLFIHEGKGEKSEFVPMLGDLPILLARWSRLQSDGFSYQYVVSSIDRHDNISKDKLCTTRVISSLCSKLSKITNIEFKPHDTRRTAITLLLRDGADISNVKAFARHKNEATTLHYAKPLAAEKLGRKLNDVIKFGNVLPVENSDLDARYFECGFGHSFRAQNPTECPKCGSVDLSHQITMFDDDGKK